MPGVLGDPGAGRDVADRQAHAPRVRGVGLRPVYDVGMVDLDITGVQLDIDRPAFIDEAFIHTRT